jgi:putative ABC transport system substrate-binding protein
MPVIGFLSVGSREPSEFLMPPFRQGLREAGYVEGQNVMPELAADLVRRQVAMMVAIGGTVVFAAKAVTATIPIVFGTAADPVEVGLVASLNRPGGNLTGVTNLNAEVGPKRLELLHEMLPTATVFALLVDPHAPVPLSMTPFRATCIRSAPVWWRAWRGREATSPVSPISDILDPDCFPSAPADRGA